MVIEALNHIIKSNYAYAIDDETIQIRLRSKKGDAKTIFIYAFDRYDKHKYTEKIKMRLEMSDKLFDYYIAEVKPKYKRLAYFFEVHDNYNKIYYVTEDNIYNKINYPHTGYFQFPIINSSDIFNPPNWIYGAIFYQIFPDRFNNGDKSNDPLEVCKWGEKPTSFNYFGGDLLGIKDKINYLKKLGINAIYLNPIFESSSNHRYDTEDYTDIDPKLGDKTNLKMLINTCHQHNIKVILDIALNHSSSKFPPFVDLIKNGEKSKYKDWFYPHSFPIINKEGIKPNYDTFAFESYMPKLNMDNKEVKSFFIDIIKYWIERFNIDGIRLDVANEVSHNFWRILRNEVKKINNDIFIIGEIWHNAMPWLIGDQFDSVTNYKLTNTIKAFFANQKINANEFKETIASNWIAYPTNVSKALLNVIDSHDTKRFLTECNNNVELFKQAILFQFTFPGIPCIYYGDEMGLTGGNDPDCRKCINWQENIYNNDIWEFYKNLIVLRKTNKALLYGDFKFIDIENPNLLAYKRCFKNDNITILLNNSKRKITIKNKYIKKYNLIGIKSIESYGYKLIINKCRSIDSKK